MEGKKLIPQERTEMSPEPREPREALQEAVKNLTERLHAVVDEHGVFAEPTNSKFANDFSYFLFRYISDLDNKIHTSGPGIPEIDEAHAKELFVGLMSFLKMGIGDAAQTWSSERRNRTDMTPDERYQKADALKESLSHAVGEAAKAFDQIVFKK